MCKNLGKFSFCLLLPKKTVMSINTRDVNLRGGPQKFRSQHWQFLSRLTTLNSSEEAERFAQVKSLPWPSVLPLFSDLPQTKTIILFVKFMVGHCARAPHDSGKIFRNDYGKSPVIAGYLLFLLRILLNLLSQYFF